MATNFEKLIDLPLLVYYDEKIKQWVTGEIGKTTGSIAFGELPEQGQEGILYVTENGLMTWDGEKFVPLAGPGGEAATWDTF